MFGLAFAQVVTAAHACPMLAPPAETPAQAASDSRAISDCAEMAKKAGSTLNVCQSHCFAVLQVDAQADIPIPAIAPQPALSMRPVVFSISTVIAQSTLASVSAAPPPLLRFSRFLI